MKTKFRGYYRIHREDLLSKFADCLFVFDASALLDIFRLNKPLTEQVFAVMRHYSDQIRVPYHAAEEYNNRINDVLVEQLKKITKAKKDFQDFENSLKAKRNQPYITDKTSKIMKNLRCQIEKDFNSQIEYITNELLYGYMQNRMADMLDAKVLDPFTEDELRDFERKGKERYAAKIPPGWKDSSKKTNSYGDYFNWEEILRLAEREKKSIIFITNDTKQDWIEEVEGKKIGPLHALSQEFYNRVKTADQLLYIYTLDKFLEFTQAHDHTMDSLQTTIDNVKNIIEESTSAEAWLNAKLETTVLESKKESTPEASKVCPKDIKSAPSQDKEVVSKNMLDEE